jgi:hypothetical protein
MRHPPRPQLKVVGYLMDGRRAQEKAASPPVTPRNTILGQIAKSHVVPNKGTIVTDIDREGLLSRLLFFDQVIVRSIRMQEVPFLTKLFGLEGLDLLMSRGILKVSCEVTTTALDRHLNGVRQLPLLQFRQDIIGVPDHEKYLEDCMGALLQITGLSNASRANLAEKLSKNIVRPQVGYESGLLNQIHADLKSNAYLIQSLIANEPRLAINPDSISVKVEEIAPGTQRFETNLPDLIGVSLDQEHAILASVVRATANLNQRLADMQTYSAITLFQESEAPLLFGKIYGIIAPHNPTFLEDAFLRVLKLTDIPDLLVTGRINAEKLLEIRDSHECREFRSWLTRTDDIDDKELKRLITGFRARASSFVSSASGKTIRLAANAGLGLIPGYGTIISLAEGVVDTFLLDKLLPSSGVLSFLNNSIPSVFVNAY